jgi:hypothetical protein
MKTHLKRDNNKLKPQLFTRSYVAVFLLSIFSLLSIITLSNLTMEAVAQDIGISYSQDSPRSYNPPITRSFLWYDNPEYRIKMQYPSDFENFGPGKSWFASFTSPTGSVSVFLNTEQLPYSGIPIEEVVRDQLQSRRYSLDDFKIVGTPQRTPFGGGPGYLATYTYSSPTSRDTWMGMEFWTIRNGVVYNVSFLGVLNELESFQEDVLRMANSVKIY